MDTSGEKAVILKEITVPLTIREWGSEQEILDHFRGDDRPAVTLHDDDYCDRALTRYVTVETPRSVLAIYAQIDDKSAEILQMSAPELWLVGVDTWVFGVNWQAGSIVLSIDLFFPFWMFHSLPDGRALIRHETGVITVNAEGRQLWYYEGNDILSDWSIGDEVLCLRFLEGVDIEAEIDLETGVPISWPGPPAQWRTFLPMQ